MNVEEIFNQAYLETNTSKADYPYEKALVVFNELYKQVWRKIVNQDKQYFWNYWTTDIQAWVTEYSISRHQTIINEWEEDEFKVPWISKVQKVFLIHDGIKEELRELSNYEEFLEAKWWTLKDNHIILNFEPNEDVENWLMIEWVENIEELTLESELEDIFPWHEDLSDFADLLYIGLREKLWRVKQDFEKANIAKVEYQELLLEMIRFISTRTWYIYYSELVY